MLCSLALQWLIEFHHISLHNHNTRQADSADENKIPLGVKQTSKQRSSCVTISSFFLSALAQTENSIDATAPAVKAADVKVSLYDRGEQTRQWDKEEPCEIRRRADRRSAWILSGGLKSPQSAGHKSVRRGRRRPGGSRETAPPESSWDSPAAPPTDRGWTRRRCTRVWTGTGWDPGRPTGSGSVQRIERVLLKWNNFLSHNNKHNWNVKNTNKNARR